MTKGNKGYDQRFRALGDAHRLRILALLKEREYNGGELLEQVDVVQSTLSHHMKTLLEAGLVTARREGKRTYYTVSGQALREAAVYLEALAREADGEATAEPERTSGVAGEEKIGAGGEETSGAAGEEKSGRAVWETAVKTAAEAGPQAEERASADPAQERKPQAKAAFGPKSGEKKSLEEDSPETKTKSAAKRGEEPGKREQGEDIFGIPEAKHSQSKSADASPAGEKPAKAEKKKKKSGGQDKSGKKDKKSGKKDKKKNKGKSDGKK